jgi:hypothetical protein
MPVCQLIKPDSPSGSGRRGAAGRDSVQHQSRAASVQAATADKASSRLLLILSGTWVVRFGARALGERRRRRTCVVEQPSDRSPGPARRSGPGQRTDRGHDHGMSSALPPVFRTAATVRSAWSRPARTVADCPRSESLPAAGGQPGSCKETAMCRRANHAGVSATAHIG